MANDCINRLQIHCDNEGLLKKIHGLFYQDKEGEIEYTMMKLIPIPPDKYDENGTPLYGFFTAMGYWGTRSNFCNTKIKWYKDEFIFEYWTANGPNHYWIEELIYAIIDVLNEYKDNNKPKIFIKHLFDVCQVMTAGYMYWEPGLDMKYEYSTEENLNQKIIHEYKVIAEERERELKVFEFHIEDYLEEEPYEDDFEDRFQRYGWNMLYFE
jgi:hypothetical protein